MMHKKARKQFAEDKQTKDMGYWNYVLWSDETKIILFRSDGVKRVWRQPGEEHKDKCVLPTVKHGGWSVMDWGCLSAAGTGELQFIEGTMNEGKGDRLAKHVSRPKPYWVSVGHPQMEGGGVQGL